MTHSAVQYTRSLLSRAGTLLLGLALVVSLSACGDDDDGGSGMNAPTVEQSISDQSATADQGAVEVADLNSVFSGENLSFQVSSSDSEVASASVDAGTLTVTPQDGGTATISAVATNDAGEASTSFGITVNLPEAPGSP
ncbi:hypothetical protein [Salinibacter ruber]|uniref:hypothetical protein n=1 Tax=Salinibacter ruber TaxID=146919 RepID=UPI002074834C|nr:hypothetical protein [Salinibacter ruber]